MSEIDELVKMLAGTHGVDFTQLVDAEVLSVDKKKRICKVKLLSSSSQNEITARLMSAVGDGILVVPVVGSTVGVLLSKKTLPTVYQFSDVDEIILRGGDLKGLLKLKESVERWNKIEDDINKIKQVFQTWTPVPNDGGAALKAAAATWFGQQLVKTTENDVENKKITHG